MKLAAVSPFVSPSPVSWLCRAKPSRNHNPRVGGSSPSSGTRRACKEALSEELHLARAGVDQRHHPPVLVVEDVAVEDELPAVVLERHPDHDPPRLALTVDRGQ